jgi:hypothetical protein
VEDQPADYSTAARAPSRRYNEKMAWNIDPRLAPFVLIAEVERGDRFVRALFARKLGGVPPESGHHLIAFHARADGAFAPAAYLHLWTQSTIGLVGGGCTDGQVVRAMDAGERAALEASGGLLLQLLGFCFAKFEPGLEAFFGHCGDARAKAVDLRAGFLETAVPNLLVRPNGALTPRRSEQLLRQAEAIGPF